MNTIETNSEIIELRRMLAIAYCPDGLYTDDGQLQDNREHPFIDFKRDSIVDMRYKMTQRNARKIKEALVAATPTTAPDPVLYWKTKDGRKIPIHELEGDHARNILYMIIRKRLAREKRAEEMDEILNEILWEDKKYGSD
jgi:hypothetical protein